MCSGSDSAAEQAGRLGGRGWREIGDRLLLTSEVGMRLHGMCGMIRHEAMLNIVTAVKKYRA